MKTNVIAGIILILLGVAALGYQGLTYTSREKAVDLGPIQVTTERTRRIPIPPVVGGLALVGGVVLLAFGGKKL